MAEVGFEELFAEYFGRYHVEQSIIEAMQIDTAKAIAHAVSALDARLSEDGLHVELYDPNGSSKMLRSFSLSELRDELDDWLKNKDEALDTSPRPS